MSVGNDEHQPGPKPTRKLPDPAVCRARNLGNDDLFDCLISAPYECQYALHYGDSFFCRHPERKEIAARTPGTRPA